MYRAGFAVKSAANLPMDFARTGASRTTRAVSPARALTANVRARLRDARGKSPRDVQDEKIMMTLFVQKDGEFEVAEANDVLACAHELMAYY